MRFAIISDIHGNLPALNAVPEDAGNNRIYLSSLDLRRRLATKDGPLWWIHGKRRMNCGKVRGNRREPCMLAQKLLLGNVIDIPAIAGHWQGGSP